MLDNIQKIKKLDSKNMLGSLELLSGQVEEIIKNAKSIKIPSAYKKINKVLVLGMGGSALGAHVFKTLYKNEIKVPVEIVNDYTVPAFVDKDTLVLVSSYSGSTEESLNAVTEASKKKAKIIGITTGGKLGAWLKKKKLPFLEFSTNNNPCGSPRMGLAYSIVGQLILLSKIGLIKLGENNLNLIKNILIKYEKLFGISQIEKNNPAKLISKDLFNKKVFFIGAEHLSGSVHIMSNQMNENAKRFSTYFLIPELNHHLLEGMIYPKSNSSDTVFLSVESNLYNKKVKKRFEITADILKQNKIENIFYTCAEKTRLGQVLEVLVLGSYLSFYSAMLQGIDPTAIPFVDYFKEQLSK